MSNRVCISLDAMGRDHGPATVVPGAAIARERHPETRFIMFGDEAVLRPLVEAEPRLKDAVEIRHTTVSVAM
ncbi:phosphate acyltransferase, partial [Vibrio parahaemolyticus]|nr:phosphate acyltransferase [Vibrio parahaemolyticus]